MAGFSEAQQSCERNFELSATGPRLLAPPSPFKALTCTGPTVVKRLMT